MAVYFFLDGGRDNAFRVAFAVCGRGIPQAPLRGCAVSSVVARTVQAMSENELLPPLEWFCKYLELREQVSLLRDPEQALSVPLAEKLSRNILVISDARLTLSPTLIEQLTDIRKRLNAWWKELDPDDRAYIIENRNGEFDGRYAVLIHDAGLASSVEGALAGVVSDGGTGRFRLPQMIRVYVEMEATDVDGAHRRLPSAVRPQ